MVLIIKIYDGPVLFWSHLTKFQEWQSTVVAVVVVLLAWIHLSADICHIHIYKYLRNVFT